MVEEWKDVKGFEGLYQVSNLGNIKSITRYKKQLRPFIDKDGYKCVVLKHKGINKHYRVSRLVAIAFIPNSDENKRFVNHLDFNRQNNCVNNLEWCTAKENIVYSVRGGRHKGANHKKASQYLNGEFIKEWESISEASRVLNIPAPNICKCLKGERKHAGGFSWIYT